MVPWYYLVFSKVYWGSGIGAAFALFWFLTTQFVLTPWFPWLCSTRLFEFFLLRDYTEIPNVLWFDYFHAKNEAKNRNRKKSFKNKQIWFAYCFGFQSLRSVQLSTHGFHGCAQLNYFLKIQIVSIFGTTQTSLIIIVGLITFIPRLKPKKWNHKKSFKSKHCLCYTTTIYATQIHKALPSVH